MKKRRTERQTEVSQGMENLGIQLRTGNKTMRRAVILFSQDRNSPLISDGRNIHTRHKRVWKTYTGRNYTIVGDNNRDGF